MPSTEALIKAAAKFEGLGHRVDTDILLDLIHQDDWKRIGPNQRGSKCGRGWEGLRGSCVRAKKGATDEEKKALRKQSAEGLAVKIRKEKQAKSEADKNDVINKIFSDHVFRTSEMRVIEKKYPDLAKHLKSHHRREAFDPAKAEKGDVILFNRGEGAAEVMGLDPRAKYYKITHAKNNHIRAIPLDGNGNPLTESSRPVKGTYLRNIRPGHGWAKINYPEDEFSAKKLLTSRSSTSSPTWRNQKGSIALELNKGTDVWIDGAPSGVGTPKVKPSIESVANFLKSKKPLEVDASFSTEYTGDRGIKKHTERLQKIANLAGYDLSEPTPRIEQGYSFTNQYVATLRLKQTPNLASRSNPTLGRMSDFSASIDSF